jgi:tRNA (cytidine/uridine-2'-O-)-methyltransferase
MDELRLNKSLEIVLFQPEIAQNMGTIWRLCGCFGVQLHVIEPCGFPFSSKALKRAALDYSDLIEPKTHMNYLLYCEHQKRETNKGRNILLTTSGKTDLWGFKFKEFDSLIFGNESSGVSDNVRESVDDAVVIPMPGGGRSLNLAVSVGITLGEALRQLTYV